MTGRRVIRYALAPLIAVLLVMGLAVSFYMVLIGIRLPGYQGDIILSIVIVIVQLVFTLACLLWAPFGAAVCKWLARGSQPQVDHPIVVSATYSATFLAPWIYQVLQMRGKRIWQPAIWLAYFLLYASWVLGPIGLSLLGFILSVTMGGQQVTAFISVLFGGSFVLMAVVWCRTLYTLLGATFNLKREAKATAPRTSTDWPIPTVYYSPFALSFGSLALFLLVGIYFVYAT